MADEYILTTGKRKTATAKAKITAGNGQVFINRKPLEIYEPEVARLKIQEALILAGDLANKVNIDVHVKGGGVMGQSAAVRMAIARGLVKFFKDPKLEAIYKEYDRNLLVIDPRRKLPKKPGGRGARKKRQKSYR